MQRTTQPHHAMHHATHLGVWGEQRRADRHRVELAAREVALQAELGVRGIGKQAPRRGGGDEHVATWCGRGLGARAGAMVRAWARAWAWAWTWAMVRFRLRLRFRFRFGVWVRV